MYQLYQWGLLLAKHSAHYSVSIVHLNSWSEVAPPHTKHSPVQCQVPIVNLHYISTVGPPHTKHSLQCTVLLKNLLHTLQCRLQCCAFQQLFRGGASSYKTLSSTVYHVYHLSLIQNILQSSLFVLLCITLLMHFNRW